MSNKAKKSVYMKEYRERNREKILLQRREYMAKFRIENPEIMKARKKADYIKHKDKYLVKQKTYRKSNPETMKKWRAENKEYIKNYKMTYNKEHKEELRKSAQKYYKNHIDEIKQKRNTYMRKFREENPEIMKIRDHNAKMKRKYLLSGKVSIGEWRELVDCYDNRCVYCGFEKPLTVDHVDSISNGGLHHIDNILPSCQSCNSSKGTKPLSEFCPEMEVMGYA